MVHIALVCVLVRLFEPSIHNALPEFPAQPTHFSDEDARSMTEALLEAITDRFDPKRLWEPVTVSSNQSPQSGGRTALAVLTLLDAGVPAQREDLASAIETLQSHTMKGSYAIAARLMAFARLPPDRLQRARDDVRLLLEAFDADACGWDYGPSPRTAFVDQSLTQFVILALAEASDRGIKVPKQVFQRVRTRFLHLQGNDGGWGYRTNDPPRGSMTAAGLATLALCDRHDPGDAAIQKQVALATTHAIAWIDAEFTADRNPGHSRWTDYWLLSAERAARATGFRKFGRQQWMQYGAASIARRLLTRTDSGWRIRGGRGPGIEKLCFAAMFMRRALEPIAISMFVEEHTPVHKSDLSMLARHLSEDLERKVGWSRLDISDSSDSWLRSPVLIVRLDETNTSNLIEPNSESARRIKMYIHHGGTVVISAPRAGLRIRKSVKSFGEWLLPDRQWQSVTHLGLPTAAESIGTRTREWLFFLPGIDPMSEKSRRVEVAIKSIAEIWWHCSGGTPWPRLPSRHALGKPPKSLVKLNIHTIRHEGEWRPEPGVESILIQRLGRRGITCSFKTITAEETEGSLNPNAIIWVRGYSGEETLSLPIDFMNTHCDAGGLVIIESVADGSFALNLAEQFASRNGEILLPLSNPNPPEPWPDELASIRHNGKPRFVVLLSDSSRGLLQHGELGSIGGEGVVSLIEWLAKSRALVNK